MTTEQINIKIAEACGWRFITKDSFNQELCGIPPDEEAKDRNLMDLPNYHSDLNACHDMERTLTDAQAQLHFDNLRQVTGSTLETLGVIYGNCHFLMYNATAPQRCEAFLRTLNLWEEKA